VKVQTKHLRWVIYDFIQFKLFGGGSVELDHGVYPEYASRRGFGITVRLQAVIPSEGRVPLVVENRKGVFSRYPKKQTGSWSESDRGGTRLCEKVYNLLVKGKVFLDRID
jgi:hypothetical protein